MNKKTVLADLAAVANMLDEHGAHQDADVVTDVMERVSQAWWQNEAGEPLYSPEAIRAEEGYVPEYNPDDFLPDRDGDMDDYEAEERSHKFSELYDYWASLQPDIAEVQKKYADNFMAGVMADAAPEIEARKQRYPEFDEQKFINNKYWSRMNPDLKSDLEELILAQSHHKNWSGDPDTMHDVLDAAKNAILSGADVKSAIDSVPGGSEFQGDPREDFGWDGGRED